MIGMGAMVVLGATKLTQVRSGKASWRKWAVAR